MSISAEQLEALPPQQQMALLLEEKLRRQRHNKIEAFKPGRKQREFIAAHARHAEVLFQAGNQVGKSLCMAYIIARHATGLYPADWNGLKYVNPVRLWAASVTAELTRDGIQKLLLGEREEEWGTGMIPRRSIIKIFRARGLPGGVSSVLVKHVTGGTSHVQFKNYEQGRQAWQADTLDLVAFDEEPPYDIYVEGLTRTNKGQHGQRTVMAATPLLGMSETVMRWLSNDANIRGADVALVRMGLKDAEHYTPEQIEKIILSYPPHERQARAEGIPVLGSGRVWNVPRSMFEVLPPEIPSHWAEIGGVDFGIDHPAAAVRVVYDRETDTAYLFKCWRARNMSVSDHIGAVNAMLRPGTPVAWPHDGHQRDRNSLLTYAQEFRNGGVNMLPDHAHMLEMHGDKQVKSNSLEGSVLMVGQRIASGRLKVAATCEEFWEEYSMYHRKDGRIVALNDDVISALRYALMEIRNAAIPEGSLAPGRMGFTYKGDINSRVDTSWVT